MAKKVVEGRFVVSNLIVEVYTAESELGPMTVGRAKEILGWEEEPASGKGWGDDYFLKDYNGKKIRLKHNDANRPFKAGLCEAYQLELFRGKWNYCGDTIVITTKENVAEGQHRLIMLILAEQKRSKNVEKYTEKYGLPDEELTIETIVVRGISDKSEVVDTAGTGAARTLSDVIFRERLWKGNRTTVAKYARIAAGALRLVWLRTGGQTVSDAPKFPITEAMDVLKKHHPKLIEMTEVMYNEETAGDEKGRISKFLSVPYATALMYLMATSGTVKSDWIPEKPNTIDWSMEEKAEKFWSEFASGADLKAGSPVLVCREALTKLTAGSGVQRDEIVGVVIKAWNAYVEGLTVTAKDLKVKKKTVEKNGIEVQELAEVPKIGGLDSMTEDADEEEKEEKVAPEPKKAKNSSKPATVKVATKVKKPKVGDIYKWSDGETEHEVIIDSPAETEGSYVVQVKDQEDTYWELPLSELTPA